MDLRSLPTEPTQDQYAQPQRAFLSVPWGPGEIALSIAVLLGLFLVPALIVAVQLASSGALEGVQGQAVEAEISPELLIFSTIFLQVGTLGLVYFLGPRRYGLSMAALGFASMPLGRAAAWALGTLAVSLLIGYVYVAVIEAVSPDLLPPTLAEQLGLDDDASSMTLFFVFITVVLLAPLSEEVFHRGFVFAGLASRWGVWSAIVASAALFALAHATFAVIVPAFLSGLLFAWVFWRTGSIWPVMVAHVVQNFAAFFGQVGV